MSKGTLDFAYIIWRPVHVDTECWLRCSCQFFALTMISLSLPFDPVHDFYVSFLLSALFFALCYSHTFKLKKKFFGHMRMREANGEEKSSYKKGQRWYIWYKVLICVRKSHSNTHSELKTIKKRLELIKCRW